jgi:hypothetical protein
MSDTTELKRRMSTPAHPDGDPTLMVVEILRITKERDALLEDKARLLESLERIANPVLWLRNDVVSQTGDEKNVDWSVVMQLSESPNYLKGIAKAAIDAAKGGAK